MNSLPAEMTRALDEAMDSLPRPEALRLETAVMDALTAAQERCASISLFNVVLDLCRGFPALLAAIQAWWACLFPVAL